MSKHPTDTQTLTRAKALQREGRFTDALGLYADLSTRHGDRTLIGAECAFFGGICAYELRSSAPAEIPMATVLTLLERAVRVKTDDAQTWLALGHTSLEAGNPERAMACAQRALSLDPGSIKAQAEYGYAAMDRGLARGRWHLELAADMTARTPSDAYNRALARLMLGRWTAGWADYERRWELDQWSLTRRYPALVSVPRGIGGRQLLVAEQGAGDTLMCVRWVPRLRERVEHLSVQVQPGLGALLRDQWPGLTVIEQGAPLPEADHWCTPLSLPHLLGVDAPSGAPYLTAPMAPCHLPPGPRVGIVWAGSSSHKNDARRSTKLQDWAPVLGVPGVTFVSLQVGEASGDLALFGSRVTDIGPSLTDWATAAAGLADLDLLICCDTGIGHLAGALGVPCWTLLGAACDWRWGVDSDRTTLYAAHRLFRQRRVNEWGPVFTEVAAALTERVAQAHDRRAA